jgi:arsenate reductase
MAKGFLRSFDTNLDVFSAGTHPAEKVNPFAVKVMKEVGIDLSNRRPKNVSEFLNQSFDYVITVCDNAKETLSSIRRSSETPSAPGLRRPRRSQRN